MALKEFETGLYDGIERTLPNQTDPRLEFAENFFEAFEECNSTEELLERQLESAKVCISKLDSMERDYYYSDGLDEANPDEVYSVDIDLKDFELLHLIDSLLDTEKLLFGNEEFTEWIVTSRLSRELILTTDFVEDDRFIIEHPESGPDPGYQ